MIQILDLAYVMRLEKAKQRVVCLFFVRPLVFAIIDIIEQLSVKGAGGVFRFQMAKMGF